MPKKFDPEIKARAVRMVRQHLAEYGSVTKTSEMVGKQHDISCNTLRRWVVQADIDDGQRDGVTAVNRRPICRSDNQLVHHPQEYR